MISLEMLNAVAGSWADHMAAALVDSTLILFVAAVIWRLVRQRLVRILDSQPKVSVRLSAGAAALLVMLATLMIPTVRASESSEVAGAATAVRTTADAPAADSVATPEGANIPNLTWQKFPAEFADYYTTQRLTGSPTEPRPFCKSGKPLMIDGSNSSLRMRAILDESGGTGAGYDTLHVDTDGDGEFANPTAYNVSPAERKTGLEGRPLVGYFDGVSLPRPSADGQAPWAQIFVEQDPTAPDGSQVVLNLIPAQWAVGAIEVSGQRVPAAMVDGAWSDNALARRGLQARAVNQMAPGDDAAALRGSYLILGRPGQEALEPGDPNGWLGQSGSARAMNTQYLVLDSGIYEIQGEKAEGGMNLQLAPATDVATSTMDLAQVPHTGRLAMFGTDACVLLENPGSQVQVPGGTYYVPAFGAYTVEVPAGGGSVTLTPPSNVLAAGPQGYNPQADREQILFTADPPGGAVEWAQPQRDPFAFANRQGWRTMELVVVNSETGNGVGGAKVQVNTYSGSGWTRGGSGSRTLTTDPAGRCSIRMPGADLQHVWVQVQTRGYVPTQKPWPLYYGHDLPAQYTWSLEPGMTIGGVVRDEHDRPIRDARVIIRAESSGPADSPQPVLSTVDIRTDRQGKWKCDAVPSKPAKLLFMLTHPDYASDTDATRSAPMEQLRDMAAVMVMKKGIHVDVKVAGPRGQPVGGAIITWGNRWNDTSNKTDRDGRFRLRNQPAGPLAITVQAAGYALDQKKVTVEPEMRTVEFKLEDAKGLKGRVIDPSGQPIALASVVLQQWRSGFYYYWNTKTDAQGRWSWADAPNDMVGVTVNADGYYGDYIQIKAGPEEHVSTLKKTVTIRGRVTDAATGQPIPAFKVILGFDQNGLMHWMRYKTVSGTNGSYTITPDAQFNEYRVRIEASGYYPAVSDIFSDADPPPSVDLALTRGEDLIGTIVGPDNWPLPDADTVVAINGEPARLVDGKFGRRLEGISAKSGADGTFRLPPQSEDYTLAAAHAQGFGQISRKEFERSNRIRLEPWGRIEGVARSGSRPLPSERWYLTTSYQGTEDSPVSWQHTLITDEAGRFTIDRVMPGIHSIQWESYGLTIEVKPGQTCHLDLGGTGRTVIGRMQLPGREKLKLEMNTASGSINLIRPGPRAPASLPSREPKAAKAWYDGWLRSEAGVKYRLAERSYWFRPKEDGSFEVPDVPAGRYLLYVSMREHTGTEKAAGAAVLEFEVPPMADGRSDTPLDLGPIQLKRCAALKAGDPAPSFSAKGFDGQGVSLAKYRGKYVLLSFWASWTEHNWFHDGMIRGLRKQFGQDERLVILGMNLDKNVEDARNYAKIHGMDWPQAHLGEWMACDVAAEYGVSWVPVAVLISPEGKIVHPYAGGYQVRSELLKVLGKPAASKPATTQAGR
jgi:peroxiredoxin/protocatechuate 3,4-dioxygenase beta subunit